MLTLVERPDVAPPPNGGYSPPQVEAMQRAIIQLFDRWGVSDAHAAILMGGISTKTFQRWKGGQYGSPSRDQADRMSLLLGIHKALRIIYSDAARGYRWIRAAEEQARAILPEGLIESVVIMSGSLRSWVHYCDLRMGNGTQKEHAEVAAKCWEIVSHHFPDVKKAIEDINSQKQFESKLP